MGVRRTLLMSAAAVERCPVARRPSSYVVQRVTIGRAFGYPALLGDWQAEVWSTGPSRADLRLNEDGQGLMQALWNLLAKNPKLRLASIMVSGWAASAVIFFTPLPEFKSTTRGSLGTKN